MGISAQWIDDTQTILLTEYIGAWTSADMRAAIDDMAALIQSVDHRVHGIQDFTRSATRLSSGIPLINHARKKLPSRGGVIVFVGGTALLKTMINFWRVLDNRRRLFTADTVEEAYTIIAAHQLPLPAPDGNDSYAGRS